jgi:hypothetical protein
MDRKSIVSEICDQADDLLAGVAMREEAKAEINEWLNIHRHELSPVEKRAITNEVLAILEEEKFFASGAGGDENDFFPAPDH